MYRESDLVGGIIVSVNVRCSVLLSLMFSDLVPLVESGMVLVGPRDAVTDIEIDSE